MFAFLVVGHGRRQLLWFAVTRNPSAEWLAQQMAEAFPWNTAPTYLVRDIGRAYGQAFQRRIQRWGFVTDPYHRGHRGRTHTLNALSERFGVSAWIMF